MRTIVGCAVVVSLGLAGRAGADTCKPELVTYYKPDKLPDKATSRCEVKDGTCKSLELKGYLYKPAKKVTAMPAHPVVVPAGSIVLSLVKSDRPPLLIFNHGSEDEPGKKCDIGTYFSNLGFVVFVPHRRGQGESTGASFAEYTSTYCSTPGQDGPCKMEYLHKQVEDVKAAIDYVKTLKDGGKPLVNATNLVLAGHSFGGIVTVFANAEDLGQKVVIDGAGASQSWEGNESARTEMKAAVKAAVAPIYFFEPLNDHSIDATIELSKVAGQACRQYQATLFPAVDADGNGSITAADYSGDWDHDGNDVDPRDKAHGTFMSDTAAWGPPALEMIDRYFTTPAKPFDSLCKGTSSQP